MRFIRWSIFGGIVALLVGVIITSQEAAKLQGEIYTTLENRYGFSSEMVITNTGENASKVVKIYPIKNGTFYKAGFRDGDQLLTYSKYKFYSLLHEKKGSSISVDVVDKSGATKTIVVNLPN
jgi:hypothetical protein